MAKNNMETFKFVGVSRHPNGELKVRYANDVGRPRVLERNGHTDMHFIEMDVAERKEDCVDALMDWAEGAADEIDADVLAVIAEEAADMGFDLARC